MSSYQIEAHLNWIEKEVEQQFDETPRRFDTKLEAYRKSLEAVEEIAGSQEVDELGKSLLRNITEWGHVPSPQEARREGAYICRDNEHDVSCGSYLAK